MSNNKVAIRDTEKIDCEVCDYVFNKDKWIELDKPDEIGPCKLYATIVMCPKCLQNQLDSLKEIADTAEVRVAENNAQAIINKSLQIDQSIQIQQDIFNAKIVSINELKLAIDGDGSIENKHFTLAQTLEARFKHLKEVIEPELTAKMKDAQNEQRAIQTYYNELAKKLRADEREQIKLKDTQYQPPDKKVSKPKAPKIQKYDKVALKKAAEDSGLPEQALQMICVARQVTPIEAVRILRSASAKD